MTAEWISQSWVRRRLSGCVWETLSVSECMDAYFVAMRVWSMSSSLDMLCQCWEKLLYICVCVYACVLLQREGCLSVYVCCLTYSFLISTIYEKLIMSALLCVYVTVRQRLCYHVLTFVGLWGRFGRRKPRRAASTERPMRCLSGGCAELQADAKDCSGRCVF